MEQEILTLKFILYIVIGLAGFFVIIFSLQKNNENEPFDWASVHKWYGVMQEETKKNLELLSKMNKEKNKLEKEIRNKKKILGMSLVNK